MKKFDKRIKIGTKVLLEGQTQWRAVTGIHYTRKWIRVEGLVGEFQRGHVVKFSNKGVSWENGGYVNPPYYGNS